MATEDACILQWDAIGVSPSCLQTQRWAPLPSSLPKQKNTKPTKKNNTDKQQQPLKKKRKKKNKKQKQSQNKTPSKKNFQKKLWNKTHQKPSKGTFKNHSTTRNNPRQKSTTLNKHSKSVQNLQTLSKTSVNHAKTTFKKHSKNTFRNNIQKTHWKKTLRNKMQKKKHPKTCKHLREVWAQCERWVVRVLRLRTPDDETTPCMDGVQTLFCLTGHRRLSGMECVNESHECALRLCRVTFLRAQRTSFFQTITQPTRCMSHVLQHVERHKEELDWNNTSV